MLVKVYGAAPEGPRRYSPAICTGAHKHRVEGNPDPRHCEHFVCGAPEFKYPHGKPAYDATDERLFKKAKNHEHMMAIYFMHYNFVRIHQTLRVTPAMAAGVAPKLWGNV